MHRRTGTGCGRGTAAGTRRIVAWDRARDLDLGAGGGQRSPAAKERRSQVATINPRSLADGRGHQRCQGTGVSLRSSAERRLEGLHVRTAVVSGGAAVERSEEHTSELQSLMRSSYAVFCLKKQKKRHQEQHE